MRSKLTRENTPTEGLVAMRPRWYLINLGKKEEGRSRSHVTVQLKTAPDSTCKLWNLKAVQWHLRNPITKLFPLERYRVTFSHGGSLTLGLPFTLSARDQTRASYMPSKGSTSKLCTCPCMLTQDRLELAVFLSLPPESM